MTYSDQMQAAEKYCVVSRLAERASVNALVAATLAHAPTSDGAKLVLADSHAISINRIALYTLHVQFAVALATWDDPAGIDTTTQGCSTSAIERTLWAINAGLPPPASDDTPHVTSLLSVGQLYEPTTNAVALDAARTTASQMDTTSLLLTYGLLVGIIVDDEATQNPQTPATCCSYAAVRGELNTREAA